MKVTIYGMGYVGVVSAAHIAGLGHKVQCVEPKITKVEALRKGEIPFYEPQLKELWLEGTSKRIVSDNADLDRIGNASIICVGTPPSNGTLDIDCVERVVQQIFTHSDFDANHTIIIRSTMPVGACKKLADKYPNVVIVFMPEFLREGTAIKDIAHPSLVCIASSSAEPAYMVGYIKDMWGYERYGIHFCSEYEEAETLKLACNAWHATKIVFTNEISRMCEAYGANSQLVMKMLCQDKVLNISPHYMKPGFSYGGSCLPKDVSELVATAELNEVYVPLLNSLHKSNHEHTDFVYDVIVKYQEMHAPNDVYILGVAFKSNTDDLRNSEVVSLIYRLIVKAILCNFKIHLVDPFVAASELGHITEGHEKYIEFCSVFNAELDIKNRIVNDPMVIVTQDQSAYQPIYEAMNNGLILDLFNMNKTAIERLQGKSGTVHYYGVSW